MAWFYYHYLYWGGTTTSSFEHSVLLLQKKNKATMKTQHLYESQNPYPNFLNGETDEGLSCTKQAECR